MAPNSNTRTPKIGSQQNAPAKVHNIESNKNSDGSEMAVSV